MKVTGIIAEYNPFHSGHDLNLRILLADCGDDLSHFTIASIHDCLNHRTLSSLLCTARSACRMQPAVQTHTPADGLTAPFRRSHLFFYANFIP